MVQISCSSPLYISLRLCHRIPQTHERGDLGVKESPTSRMLPSGSLYRAELCWLWRVTSKAPAEATAHRAAIAIAHFHGNIGPRFLSVWVSNSRSERRRKSNGS